MFNVYSPLKQLYNNGLVRELFMRIMKTPFLHIANMLRSVRYLHHAQFGARKALSLTTALEDDLT